MSTQIRPQPGPQHQFLASQADLAIFGGQAGGGKSYGLLLDPLRHVRNPEVEAVLFRKTMKQIDQPKGLWSTSEGLYPSQGARPLVGNRREWRFPSGFRVSMHHMQNPDTHLNWQGAQVPWAGWDELTHFKGEQFWYLMSRMRSMANVKSRVRATCNPDPDSFVAGLVDWWIGEDGFPRKERSGALRWLLRYNDTLYWSSSRDTLAKKFADVIEDPRPLSMTFIPSSIYDNKILMDADPDYLAYLQSLPAIDKARLLGGNWKVRQSGGLFSMDDLQLYAPTPEIPKGTPFAVLDCAYTDEARADWSAFIIGVVVENRSLFILHSWREQLDPLALVEKVFEEMAHWGVRIGLDTLHMEAHKMAFATFNQEMRLRNTWFALEELKHGGRAKPQRIREIRAHLPRLYFREHKDDWLRSDLVAYNPKNEGKVSDDGPDALAYLCEVAEYDPNHLTEYTPRLPPAGTVEHEIEAAVRGYRNVDVDEGGMI